MACSKGNTWKEYERAFLLFKTMWEKLHPINLFIFIYLGEFDFPLWFSLFYQSVKISFSYEKCQCKNKFYFYRESDRDVVAAASSIFIVSSVKVAAQTTELIKSELHHQLPDQRINALLRFQVRFKFEYTVVLSVLYKLRLKLSGKCAIYRNVTCFFWFMQMFFF